MDAIQCSPLASLSLLYTALEQIIETHCNYTSNLLYCAHCACLIDHCKLVNFKKTFLFILFIYFYLRSIRFAPTVRSFVWQRAKMMANAVAIEVKPKSRVHSQRVGEREEEAKSGSSAVVLALLVNSSLAAFATHTHTHPHVQTHTRAGCRNLKQHSTGDIMPWGFHSPPTYSLPSGRHSLLLLPTGCQSKRSNWQLLIMLTIRAWHKEESQVLRVGNTEERERKKSRRDNIIFINIHLL